MTSFAYAYQFSLNCPLLYTVVECLKRGLYFKKTRLWLIFKHLKCINNDKLMQNNNDLSDFKLFLYKTQNKHMGCFLMKLLYWTLSHSLIIFLFQAFLSLHMSRSLLMAKKWGCALSDDEVILFQKVIELFIYRAMYWVKIGRI